MTSSHHHADRSMIIARLGFWRKTIVTAIAAVGFVSLYEVTIARLQVRRARSRRCTRRSALPLPGARLAFSATAYCKGSSPHRASPAQSGVAAADPELLPVGSVIEIDSPAAQYNGIYTVMDTGPAVQGAAGRPLHVELQRGAAFGRRPVRLTVLRLGWNPRATTPSFLDRMFKRPSEPRTASRAPAAARPFRCGSARDLRPAVLRASQLLTSNFVTSNFSTSNFVLLPILQLEQLEVNPALRQQFLVRAGLAQLSLVQHEDLVHVLDRREPVRDRDRRSAGHQHAAARRESAARSRCRRSTSPRRGSARADRRPARARTTAAASARPTASTPRSATALA